MTQNHGGRFARQPTSNKPGRPSLDRPSLFAGMDSEDSTIDGDTQRVRILSTLESARSSSGRKKLPKIHGITKKKRRSWQTKALMGLLGFGVLTLLTSFVMVVREGHDKPVKPESEPHTKQVASLVGHKKINDAVPQGASDRANPLAALMAPPAHPAAPPIAPQVALIENVISAPPPSAESTLHSAVKPVEPDAAKQAPPRQAPVVASVSTKPASIESAPPVNSLAKPPLPVAAVKRAPASKSKDEDVALLEAMFAHTRPRPAAVSVADELNQRCGSLNGAEAATCRARVCVQNPTAAACHQD